jgi:hypothetical protein
MIDYVIGGEYLNVTSNKGAQPYINMSSNQPMIGAMSYDSGSQNMKVYDGSNWLAMGGGSATVNLTGQAVSILKWAEKKMQEEKELFALAEKHPTIKSLVDEMNVSIDTYHHKILMVKTLLKEEEKIATS